MDNWHVQHPYMPKRRVKSRLKAELQKNYIREWRKYREMSLERLADRLGTSHATLSRVERGRQPWNERLLYDLAEALQTDWQSLLMRDPTDPEGLWSIWDQAKPGERRQIIEHAKIILKTGT